MSTTAHVISVESEGTGEDRYPVRTLHGPYIDKDAAEHSADWLRELFPGADIQTVAVYIADPALISILHLLAWPKLPEGVR